MGIFITFEGGEGSGKSYQSKALYRHLSGLSIPVILTHEPGGTEVGERVTRLVKWAHGIGITPLTELLLFNASRAQLVEEVIKPGLKQGKVIICDRFTDSTMAYQSYGRGLSLELVDRINMTATNGLRPDLTVLIDVPVEEGLKRKSNRKHDRFELEAIEFHKRVRVGYLKLATNESERFLIVDGLKTKPEIEKIIWDKVSRTMERT